MSSSGIAEKKLIGNESALVAIQQRSDERQLWSGAERLSREEGNK